MTDQYILTYWLPTKRTHCPPKLTHVTTGLPRRRQRHGPMRTGGSVSVVIAQVPPFRLPREELEGVASRGFRREGSRGVGNDRFAAATAAQDELVGRSLDHGGHGG